MEQRRAQQRGYGEVEPPFREPRTRFLECSLVVHLPDGQVEVDLAVDDLFDATVGRQAESGAQGVVPGHE